MGATSNSNLYQGQAALVTHVNCKTGDGGGEKKREKEQMNAQTHLLHTVEKHLRGIFHVNFGQEY